MKQSTHKPNFTLANNFAFNFLLIQLEFCFSYHMTTAWGRCLCTIAVKLMSKKKVKKRGPNSHKK